MIRQIRAVQIPSGSPAHKSRNGMSIIPESPFHFPTTTNLTTPAGIRLRSKAIRAASRNTPSFGQAMAWHRQAATAYTWARTDKGPLRRWLHQIGKADSPTCPCSPHSTQNGHHVTFECPLLLQARLELLRGRTTWESLDSPVHTRPPRR